MAGDFDDSDVPTPLETPRPPRTQEEIDRTFPMEITLRVADLERALGELKADLAALLDLASRAHKNANLALSRIEALKRRLAPPAND